MDFTNELTNLIKANISSLYIQSYEWQRFQAKIVNRGVKLGSFS